MSKYAKFVVAALGAAVVALGAAYTDGHLTGEEVAGIVVAGLTAVGVLLTPNKPA